MKIKDVDGQFFAKVLPTECLIYMPKGRATDGKAGASIVAVLVLGAVAALAVSPLGGG